MAKITRPGPGRRQLPPCPRTRNCVSSQADLASQRIAPLSFSGPGSSAMSRLAGIVATMPHATVVESTPHSLRAEFASPVLRFVDDLEALLDETETVIHVRSASRAGVWDLGANRRRVESLRRRFADAQESSLT